MGSTRDLIISFVEGSCEDRINLHTQAGIVDKVWLASRPPEISKQRITPVSAFQLNQDWKACNKDIGPKIEQIQPQNFQFSTEKKIQCRKNDTSKEKSTEKVSRNMLKYPKSKCPHNEKVL